MMQVGSTGLTMVGSQVITTSQCFATTSFLTACQFITFSRFITISQLITASQFTTTIHFITAGHFYAFYNLFTVWFMLVSLFLCYVRFSESHENAVQLQSTVLAGGTGVLHSIQAIYAMLSLTLASFVYCSPCNNSISYSIL